MPSILSKKKELPFTTLVLLLGLSLLLVLFDSIGFFDPLKNFGVIIGNRLGSDVASQINVFSGRLEMFRENEEFAQKIEDLENEKLDLISENTALRIGNQELSAWKEQEEFSEDKKPIPALIIGYPSDKFGHTVINKGSESAVEVGDYVVLKNYLVGEILEANSETSVVRMINSPNSMIPVTSLTHNTQGVSKGDVNKGLMVRDIAQGGSLEEGEIIITSGINSKFVRGLILGKVRSIDSNANQATKSAELDLVLGLNDLTEVFVFEAVDLP